MKKNLYKRRRKTLVITLLPFFILSSALSVYSLLQPTTITNQLNGNKLQMLTNYDFKAEIRPNILYPDGGTIDVGPTIFKKITTAIPVRLKSTITAENSVVAEGTHEVQLVIKAGSLWERSFPLEQKQDFKQEGTKIALIDNDYKIDLQSVQSFITQVEDETGIHSDQYVLEVIPAINGKILYNGVERTIQIQDALAFQYSFDEISLSGEKTFTTSAPFLTEAQTITNPLKIAGFELPLQSVRISSSLLSILLLIFLAVTSKGWLLRRQSKHSASQTDRINKKYRNRVIPVSQKINISQKSIFILDSFQSVIKISDEKELPIFFYKDHQNKSGTYFIVDGDYLYSYETSNTDLVSVAKSEMESEQIYARR
ncbi:hypothetical protein FAY30_21900 [Bacillus sp. S3]|uniref:DUF5305 family protein n=1 Tax=Bacillus sp. S3 TaxID=486398 RepID=UPI00118B2F98|nr:DUF5305 family protein [Bacillus sp. S3]QCJ44343.1 hypothetical protein FAY30_21900 [Bacillus sp. S3]